jgi:uncharacterized surface protein with fasciclin (FAS1) repeats
MQWIRLLLAVTVMSFLAACGGDDDDAPPDVQAPLNLLQTLQADARFTTLVEAVNAAGLAGALTGADPLTVFAPTNDGFDALLVELGISKEALLADTALLTQVLSYHVLQDQVAVAGIELGRAITPLQGGFFKIDDEAGTLVATDGRNRTANLVQADLLAGNGVIHVLDKVLLPANQDIVQTAQALPGFSVLVEAVVAANLVSTLQGPGPFTVFAPTDAAFTALLAELGITKDALLADTALLTQVLTYHVVSGRVLKADVPVGTPIPTVQGETFSVGATLAITDQRNRTANITATDVLTTNGVIHVIDRVILPSP